MNRPGDPIVGRDEEWEGMERERLRFPPRELTREQQVAVQWFVPVICGRGGWKYLQCAGAPDHVHVVVAAEVEGDAVRKWLKRWLGEAMSERWPTEEGASGATRPGSVAPWWAEGGSVRWVWTEDYFNAVIGYVNRQRARVG